MISGRPFEKDRGISLIRISVVIPTYNRAEVLARAVQSVLSQSFLKREIIVIDDGSTDDTESVINRLGTGIRYLPCSHAGVSAARNRGIEASRGDWIAFLDSDDYWLPEKLAKQYAHVMRETPEDVNHERYLICHTDEIWIRDGKRINQGKKHRKYAGWFFEPSLRLCLISPSSVLIHREVFEQVGMFDETFPYVEDYDLWLRITARFPVGYIDEKLTIKTGGHQDQLSSSIDGIEKYRLRALSKILLRHTLTEEQQSSAVKVYREKAEIYLKGCMKRGKLQEARKIREQLLKLSATIPAEGKTTQDMSV
jgi:glycosyltransferase involved in cell wall biosynthesis